MEQSFVSRGVLVILLTHVPQKDTCIKLVNQLRKCRIENMLQFNADNCQMLGQSLFTAETPFLHHKEIKWH